MIASLRGTVVHKDTEFAVIEASGVGYEVHMTPGSLARLPDGEAFVFVEESVAMYGGGIKLYGFLDAEEKKLFGVFRDNIPSTGAKKALEYLEKASKSLPDFRRAVLERDGRILSGVFGFTKKTADRLIDALKDKLEGVPLSGPERIKTDRAAFPAGPLGQALDALSALGYKPSEAKTALAAVSEKDGTDGLSAEQIVRLALRKL
jgi:holliday junction DNA helicase RuvA